jgi:hypothetical protein
VAGWYAWQAGPSLHAAGPALEAGVTLLEERLAVGVRCGWQPTRAVPGTGTSTSLQAVPVSLAVHGGWRFRSLLLRGVLEAGAEWRKVEATFPQRFQPLRDSSAIGFLGGEVEVVALLGETWRAGLAATVRGYLERPSFVWQGGTAIPATEWSIGTALWLGAVFPRVSPAPTAPRPGPAASR